ncbi:putative WW domain-containing oxidoreductase [Seiridium unicorne]|uniref:WW domain-containing oxidoreductase n=1 Tax=Seiridium unicorne TaxID=138068 RepID=A0ABR2UPN1_9PEZI
MVSSLHMQPHGLSLLTSQLCAKPPASLSNINLARQTAIVTGGNSGIGLEAARQLLAAGLSYLIIAVRSSDKGKIAAEQLKSNAPSSEIEVWSLDMSAEKAAKSPGRLTIVSSGNAFVAKFENKSRRPLLASFDDPSVPYDGMERYNVSKLLGHYWIKKMAEYVSPDDVIIDLVEPGLTKGTSLFREPSIMGGTPTAAFFWIGRYTHKYASMLYEDGNEKVANQLWDETLEELEFSGIRDIMESVRKR